MMGIKSMLQKYFIEYGEKGASKPSMRGSYEAAVPEALKQKALAKKQDQNQHKAK